MSRRRPPVDPLVEMDKAREAIERSTKLAAILLTWPRRALTSDAQRDRWAALQVACLTCRAPRGVPCTAGRGVPKLCAWHANRKASIEAWRRRDAAEGGA